MEILSQDTLVLLRNEKLRKAVEEVLQQPTNSSKTVTVVTGESDSGRRQEPTEVTVRRIST